MILVSGLSPAWQQIMRFPALRLGDVNRALEVHHCASGKVVNVAIALAQLGANCELVSVAGGVTGRVMQRDFEIFDVVAHWVTTTAPTRICTTLLEEADRRTSELVENASPISPSELTEFRSVFLQLASAAQLVIITGSAPHGVSPLFWPDLIDQTEAPVILDIRGPELLAALERRPLLVKPNREELAAALSQPIEDDAGVIAAMERVRERGATWVVVTDGARPLWISGPDGVFCATPPVVPVINPIGSGDSLAAGIAWALQNEKPMLEAIRMGIAAAADNAAQLLPARIDRSRVRELLARVTLEAR